MGRVLTDLSNPHRPTRLLRMIEHSICVLPLQIIELRELGQSRVGIEAQHRLHILANQPATHSHLHALHRIPTVTPKGRTIRDHTVQL